MGNLFFMVKGCEPCKLKMKKLDEKGIKYQIVDCDENPDTVMRFNVRASGTLVDEETGNKIDIDKL